MLTALATMLLAVAPPTGFSQSVERIAVRRTSGPVSVEADPMTARVVLHGLALTEKPPRLCPVVTRKEGVITLTCNTRRLWAGLQSDPRGTYVDVRQLTAVSWLDDASRVPMRAWSLRSVLIPDVCPGTTAAARGECALGKGDLGRAREAWDMALTGPDLGLAHLRLGDLALVDGDVELALKHYSKVTSVGPVGRMAQARACELSSSCLNPVESERVANSEGLALELARELTLYTLRREMAVGHDQAAMTLLLSKLETDLSFCQGAVGFCQKLIEGGLASTDVEARLTALSAFLTDKVRKGPYELALNEAAAASAQEIGAPGFAAAILAGNTPNVAHAHLADHLLEVVRLYLAARDPIRAAVVLEYAEGKLGAASRSGGWVAVRRQLNRPGAVSAAPAAPIVDEVAMEQLSTQVSLSTELARAAATHSRAAQNVPSSAPVEIAP